MQTISSYMGTFLQFANVCIILFGFYKFLGKPHSTLESRVSVLEKEMKEAKDSLKLGNKKFNAQNKGITVIMESIIALIEWEFQYCSDEHKTPSEALLNAKKKLNSYLASTRGFNDDEDE